jgi:hypothetical protein
MDKNKQEYNKIYISDSKKNIDSYINKKEYRKAFVLLIWTLERIDNAQKNEFIDYYSKNMLNMGIFDNIFPNR